MINKVFECKNCDYFLIHQFNICFGCFLVPTINVLVEKEENNFFNQQS